MSHVKTMQSFGKLKGICTGLGGAYNPGNQNLQVKALTAQLFNAQQVMDEFIEAKTAYDNITNRRELAFRNVRALGSRITFLLKSCGAHPLTIADALSQNRKLQGKRASSRQPVPITTAEETSQSIRHVYGMDYASRAYYFAQLVETATAEPQYQPNEPELTVEGLDQKVLELRSLNELVMKAEHKLSQIRKQRNVLFYEGENSLVATARAVKYYIRGVFGFTSNPSKELVKVSLTKPTTR